MLADVAAKVNLDRPRIILMTCSGCEGTTARALRNDRFRGQVLLLEDE